MKKIRFIEETNGQIDGSRNGVRYKGRDVYEDKVRYEPKIQEPRLYTLIDNYNGIVRKRGKWSKNRVLENYPNAKGYWHIVKETNAQYKVFTLRACKHRKINALGRQK